MRSGGIYLRSWAVAVLAILAESLLVQVEGFDFNEENSCVLLNADNTDIISFPDDCINAKTNWCNCASSILTSTVRGEPAGLEQGVIWVTGQPGIGNHRIEVFGGTLDLSSLQPGDVIGGTLANELVPPLVALGCGEPTGSFLTTRSEIQVVSVAGNVAELNITMVEISPITPCILDYDVFDDSHSNGLFYKARIESHGPGKGFTFNYRYDDPVGADQHLAIEPSDADSPGFNVRFALSLFTADFPDGDGIFVLPGGADELDLTTTLRMFREAGDEVANRDEVLPLDAEDLCVVVEELDPCKVTDESIPLTGEIVNNPPVARIVATDATTLKPLLGDEVNIDCGIARVLLRGSNSSDGDNGTQGLSYLWEITEGEPGGAEITPGTETFMDAEMSVFEEGIYIIQLTVNDGQAENNIGIAEVELDAFHRFGPNAAPVIESVIASPEPPVPLDAGGTASVHLEVIATAGDDDCFQTPLYLWESLSGPAPVTFTDERDDDTDAVFTEVGDYTIRITVDDGAPEDSIARQVVMIEVVAEQTTFQRCDTNGDGGHDIADPIYALNRLFSGGPPPPCEASMDCNSDGGADVSDPIFDLNFQFAGGPMPAPPFPGCDVAGAGESCAMATPCK